MKNLIIIIAMLLSITSFSQKIYVSDTIVAMCKYDTITDSLYSGNHSEVKIAPTIFKFYPKEIVIQTEESITTYTITGTKKEDDSFITYKTTLNNKLIRISYYKDPTFKGKKYNAVISMLVDEVFMQFLVK